MQRDSIQLDVNMPPNRTHATHCLLADIKKKTLRSRILSALFGDQHEVVIILPSRSVDTVTFTRAGEGRYATPADTSKHTAAADLTSAGEAGEAK